MPYSQQDVPDAYSAGDIIGERVPEMDFLRPMQPQLFSFLPRQSLAGRRDR